jgi:hypothetical protein
MTSWNRHDHEVAEALAEGRHGRGSAGQGAAEHRGRELVVPVDASHFFDYVIGYLDVGAPVGRRHRDSIDSGLNDEAQGA